MAQLIVAVEDPFQLGTAPAERAVPLLLGSYVRVEIDGPELKDVVTVSRSALREGDTVWVVDANEQLEIRPVKVKWRARDSVLVGEGLAPGERIVTSRLAVPLEKMALRVIAEDDDASEQ